MSNKIESLVTRIEADGKIIVYVDEEDRIKKGFFYPFMPVRGFSKMFVGKDLEFLPVAAMRICGVCHVTHGIAAIEATEHVLGITPPKDGLILREIAGLGNRLQSHAMHMLFLYKDFFEDDRTVLKKIFRMLEVASEIVKISGHAPIHPSNVCVGGMLKNVSDKGKEEIEKSTREYRTLMEEFRISFEERLNKMVEENKIPEDLGNVNLPFLATHPFYGDRNEVNLLDISVVPPERYYDLDEPIRETGSSLAMYNNEITEVGPRARLKRFFRFDSRVPLAINMAYIEDALKGCDRVEELCGILNTNGETRAFFEPKSGIGIGVHEAPRGTNVHVVNLRRDGIIMDYRIIVPTMFNIPVIDAALVGAPLKFAGVIVRSYDPCLSCATHKIVVRRDAG